MTKSILISLVCLMTLPALVRAQQPATQPSQGNPYRRLGGGGMMGGRFGQNFEDEWKEAAPFMKENSPKRFEVFEQLDSNRDKERYQQFRRFAVMRYRMLKATKVDDPTMYDLRTARLKVEDDIFGLVKDTRPDEIPPKDLQDKLREKVTLLVDLGVKERQARIERLKKIIETEQQKIETETAKRDQIIDDRTKKFLTDGADTAPKLDLPKTNEGDLGLPRGKRPHDDRDRDDSPSPEKQ